MTKNSEYNLSLLQELCKLPNETEWLEFKCNNDNPECIGEYISALSNSAALIGKANAYIIWGVADNFLDLSEVHSLFDCYLTGNIRHTSKSVFLRLKHNI